MVHKRVLGQSVGSPFNVIVCIELAGCLQGTEVWDVWRHWDKDMRRLSWDAWPP
jgi:hypothetical protein